MIIGVFTLLISLSQGTVCVGEGCSLLPFGELVVKQFIHSVQATPCPLDSVNMIQGPLCEGSGEQALRWPQSQADKE